MKLQTNSENLSVTLSRDHTVTIFTQTMPVILKIPSYHRVHVGAGEKLWWNVHQKVTLPHCVYSVAPLKAVNRQDKLSRRYRDRDLAKFESSRRYRQR
jgi:hypothetical protein